MIDPKVFDEMAKRLSDLVPNGLHVVKDDLQTNFKAALQAAFSQLDLVTRDEFDVQVNALAKARAKLASLEAQVQALGANTSTT